MAPPPPPPVLSAGCPLPPACPHPDGGVAPIDPGYGDPVPLDPVLPPPPCTPPPPDAPG